MAENITQFPKTLILKKRGIEIKRKITELYNPQKLQVKEFWIRENVLKPMGEFVAKETLDIVNTVLSNGAAVADVNMDFNKLHGQSEIAKEINDFVLVLMYSSTLTMIGWLLGYLER
jgi:hypothetical protein